LQAARSLLQRDFAGPLLGIEMGELMVVPFSSNV
jgi:hypothetical protein